MSQAASVATCQQVLEGVGSGVAASLRAVDCAASATAQAAFGRLFGTDGALLPALTILLTLYVGFFAFSLITGRSRLGISALTPRMITLGLVLTFATSWIAYQGVVWNLAVGAPDQIAGILMGTKGPATQIFADKIDAMITKLVESSGNGIAPTTTFSPLGLMWLGGILLLLGTVGVLATCKIALAILLALGPVFVVLALFTSTRGLFTGWLKGVVLLAVAPLFAVLGGSLMLELAVPVLASLAPTLPGQIDPHASMAFFMIGVVHVALMVMAVKVSGAMVAGWRVFGLARDGRHNNSGRAIAHHAPPQAAPVDGSGASPGRQAGNSVLSRQRNIRIPGVLPPAANDSGSARHPQREFNRTNLGANATTTYSFPSRTQGIGSRFRAPTNRQMEKFR